MSFSDTQIRNAFTIAQVGQRLGATGRQILAAIGTAWTESRLGTLDGGDQGTAWGIFQQRPVAGWGSREQVENPEYAATAFFQGTQNNAGLFDVWHEQRSTGLNAQAVQRSAYPSRYDNELPQIRGVFDRVMQMLGSGTADAATGAAPVSESSQGTRPGDAQQGAEPVLSEAPINPGLGKVIALGVGTLLLLLAVAKLAGQ